MLLYIEYNQNVNLHTRHAFRAGKTYGCSYNNIYYVYLVRTTALLYQSVLKAFTNSSYSQGLSMLVFTDIGMCFGVSEQFYTKHLCIVMYD